VLSKPPVAPRPPEFKRHRVAVYVLYGIVCAVMFFQLIRSVSGDLYGQPASRDTRPATPQICLEEVERLAVQLGARAALPAPGAPGHEERAGTPDEEWDRWARRWEADVTAVGERCKLGEAQTQPMKELAAALEALEDLRRDVATSGEQTAATARRVRDLLGAARAQIQQR
jgi:hypothetical protein